MSACVSLPASACVGWSTGIDYDVYPELIGKFIVVGKGESGYLLNSSYSYDENHEFVAESSCTWGYNDFGSSRSFAVGDILNINNYSIGETFPVQLFTTKGSIAKKVATCDEYGISTDKIADTWIEKSSYDARFCVEVESYRNEDFVVNEDVLQYVDENNLTYDDYKRIAAEGLDNSDLAKGSDIVLGDVDGDGETSVLDVISVNRYILGKADFSETQFTSADVDKSGIVDSADALLMMKKVVGIVEEF